MNNLDHFSLLPVLLDGICSRPVRHRMPSISSLVLPSYVQRPATAACRAHSSRWMFSDRGTIACPTQFGLLGPRAPLYTRIEH